MKNIFFTLIILLSGSALFAQANNWCGTDQYNQSLLDNMTIQEAEYAINRHHKIFDKTRKLASNQKAGPIITVPVVVHVLHDDCDGNITKAQVEDGLRIINEDFRRMNSDSANTRSAFLPFATDAEIEFKLAQIDPNNNCTEGIVRVNTPVSNEFPYGGQSMTNAKNISRWPSNKYLNIWLVNSIENQSAGTILGYAQFPGYGSWNNYGLVVRSDQWGSIGTSNADGRTGTHEIGHCLGLFHTFQSGCGGSCQSSGDRICDTPPSYQATYSCSKTQNTCSNDASGNSPYTSDVTDQIENYMSYDNCQNMYTIEQRDVMKTTLNDASFPKLNNLVSASNLSATGTNPGYVAGDCKPKADVCQTYVTLCEGNTVTYTDRSYNGPISSRTWSFPGGSPASSSDSIVTITYPSSGVYDATLTVSNSQGSSSKKLSNIVNVLTASAQISNWRYDERFEDPDAYDSLWTIDNSSGGKKWELTNRAAYRDQNSVYISNYINTVGLVDILISPSYDLSKVIAPRLAFKLAYARKSASSLDILTVEYSFDCGENWYMLSTFNSFAMESVSGYVTSDFIPADQSEWKELNKSLPTFVASKPNVRFRFSFASGGGNNIYMDDIMIESLTGIDDVNNGFKPSIFPNPVTDRLTIDFSNSKADIQSITIMDISGSAVSNVIEASVGGKVETDVSNLNPGLYFIQLNYQSGERQIEKIVVE